MAMYRLSRYWNRLAYCIINLGRKMIWDYTGKNDYLLSKQDFGNKSTEDIMCDRS